MFLSAVASWGCSSQERPERFRVDDGFYHRFQPKGVPDNARTMVHLHPTGSGEELAKREQIQLDLAEAGFIGVFPEGFGSKSDDWNVGGNVDGIERDDVAFLHQVAVDLAERFPQSQRWLSGSSKGAAMVYEFACYGEPDFVAYIPMTGALEKPLDGACTNEPKPISHFHGVNDLDRWPFTSDLNPQSTHMGIVDSLAWLPSGTDACMSAEPVVVDNCLEWPSCPSMTRYCSYDGGHRIPPGWMLLQREAMDALDCCIDP